jgi:hypothetical protein
MVVALVALVAALGGTAFAQTVLPRNSVGPRQIRANAVRSSEVKDRSLRVADLSVQARRSLRGQRGPAGPPGPGGGTGTGTGTGTATTLTVVAAPGVVSAGNVTSATATCPPGRTVSGGGVRIDSAGDSSMRESYPSQNNTAWTARVGNDDVSGNFNYTVFAVCAA